MIKVNNKQSIDFYNHLYEIHYNYNNDNIKNVLAVHLDSSKIVLLRFIYNIIVEYHIYEYKEPYTYYITNIETYTSNQKLIRRMGWISKNGKSTYIKVDFYTNNYYITVANDKFSVYDDQKVIFNNMNL